MLRLCISMLTLAVLAAVAGAEIRVGSSSPGKLHLVTITDEALKNTPSWKDDAENPPFPAGKAIKLANEMKDSLVQDTEDFRWELQTATLTPAGGGKWYWVVEYEFASKGRISISGRPYTLRLVVLMDGTIEKPVVKDE